VQVHFTRVHVLLPRIAEERGNARRSRGDCDLERSVCAASSIKEGTESRKESERRDHHLDAEATRRRLKGSGRGVRGSGKG